MNVIQTEVVFPIAYIVMHYYFISKNLFPNNIAGYSIGTRRKENLQSKITVMIYQPPFSRIFFCLNFAPRQGKLLIRASDFLTWMQKVMMQNGLTGFSIGIWRLLPPGLH